MYVAFVFFVFKTSILFIFRFFIKPRTIKQCLTYEWLYTYHSLINHDIDAQLQPTGGPHNSLRTHLRAIALVYTYIEGVGVENSKLD